MMAFGYLKPAINAVRMQADTEMKTNIGEVRLGKTYYGLLAETVASPGQQRLKANRQSHE